MHDMSDDDTLNVDEESADDEVEDVDEMDEGEEEDGWASGSDTEEEHSLDAILIPQYDIPHMYDISELMTYVVDDQNIHHKVHDIGSSSFADLEVGQLLTNKKALTNALRCWSIKRVCRMSMQHADVVSLSLYTCDSSMWMAAHEWHEPIVDDLLYLQPHHDFERCFVGEHVVRQLFYFNSYRHLRFPGVLFHHQIGIRIHLAMTEGMMWIRLQEDPEQRREDQEETHHDHLDTRPLHERLPVPSFSIYYTRTRRRADIASTTPTHSIGSVGFTTPAQPMGQSLPSSDMPSSSAPPAPIKKKKGWRCLQVKGNIFIVNQSARRPRRVSRVVRAGDGDVIPDHVSIMAHPRPVSVLA
ncbi:hypothetical protein QJS10_CPB12g00583 [Acorus calamus]|uniref:Uncharacterized protein n=1 Tax=Acorus calamus TaxID=4465 RepID=A0AAV9DL58_ACOCL|nr:hypothetical protein QJS10_CPB12g00583 [Acorus calamus]